MTVIFFLNILKIIIFICFHLKKTQKITSKNFEFFFKKKLEILLYIYFATSFINTISLFISQFSFFYNKDFSIMY